MGLRRILTARDQVAMMAPWRKHAAATNDLPPQWPEDLRHHLTRALSPFDDRDALRVPYDAGYAAASHPYFGFTDSGPLALESWQRAGGQDLGAYQNRPYPSNPGFLHGFKDARQGASNQFDDLFGPSNWNPDERQDPFDPRLLGASLRTAGEAQEASWPDDLAHHLDEPTGYSAGYAAYHHPAFAGDWNKAEEAYYVNAGGAGSKFEDGFEDAGEGAPHRIDQVSKKYKPLRDIASELRQRRHNEFSGMGDLTVNEHGMPDRSEGPSTSHPKGSWEGCPTCNPRQSMDGDEYQDPDDNIDPFDPRLLGASRTASVWDWKPYTPTLVQRLKGENLWDGDGVDERSWETRSDAGDHYYIRPAGSVFNNLPSDHPHRWTGDPNHWEVDHLPPEYGHDPEGYMGDIYGPTALNEHARPVDGVHPHGFSSPEHAMDWVKSRHPEESFDPDDKQDPFDPRLLGASRRTAADESIILPPDEPHTDWRPKYKVDSVPTIYQWHPPYGETHVKYHIWRAGGGRNPLIWGANHHGTHQGTETISSPHGEYPDFESPKYSTGGEPEQLGRFKTPEQAKAAAEAHYRENYSQPPSHDYDIDSIMDEHGAPPAAGNRGLGDDEDYSRIFDAAMRRYAGDRADLKWERDGSGDWVLIGRNPDGNPVALMTKPAPNVRTSSRYYYTDAEAYGHDDDDDDDDAWVEGERAPAEAEYPDGYCDWCDGKLSDPTAQPKWDGASYRWLCDTCHDAISGPAHRHLSDEMRMYRGWDPDGEDFDAGDPRIKGARRTAARDGSYDEWEEYDNPEDWVDDYPLEDENQESYLRRVYEPYPADSPTLPDHLKPHLHLPTEVAHHYREYDRDYDKNTQMLERIIGDQGIRQPLRISTDGTHALLHEGNHRLHAARRLGISHVPVQVTLEKPGEIINNGARPPSPIEPVLGDWLKRNGHTLRSFWD